MGDRYFVTLQCPHCKRTNYDCYYAPTCDFTTWRCEYCDEEFDIEEQFSQEELAGYVDEAERSSKMMEDLVASFQKPLVPMPVISQLAIAIEETLKVYHEPHFIHWACRCLQGIVDKKFNAVTYMPNGGSFLWEELAAAECVQAARQPTPDGLIENAAIAIEAALCAQDVMAKIKEKDCGKNE